MTSAFDQLHHAMLSRADRGLARVLLEDEAVEDVAASILRDGR